MNLLLEYKQGMITAIIRSAAEENKTWAEELTQSDERRMLDVEDGIIVKAILIKNFGFRIHRKYVRGDGSLAEQSVVLRHFPEEPMEDPQDQVSELESILGAVGTEFVTSRQGNIDLEIIASGTFYTKEEF